MAKKDFDKYIRLYKILCQLIAKSDKIRDELDEPWHNMTKKERSEVEEILDKLKKEYDI